MSTKQWKQELNKEWQNAPKEFFVNLKIASMNFSSIFFGSFITLAITLMGFCLINLLIKITKVYPFFIFGMIMVVYSIFFLKRNNRELARSLSVIVLVFICAIATIIFEKFGYEELSILPGFLIGVIFAFIIYKTIKKIGMRENENETKKV